MPPMKFDDMENKRADEGTFHKTASTPPAGGTAAGGTDNKRADHKCIEVKAGRVSTSGQNATPEKVMKFSGERI